MATIPPQSSLSRLGQYHPRLIEAALALNENDLPRAEPLLRAHLKEDPFDVLAIRMFAELAGRIGRFRDAETLLRRALEIAPGFTAARSNLALLLHRQNRPEEALEELDRVRTEEPEEPGHETLQAAVAGRIGAFDEALALYEAILSRGQGLPPIWLSYGHTLKTVGRLDDGIAAYRKAIALQPHFGEAWWSIANLKTAQLGAQDMAAMNAGLPMAEASLSHQGGTRSFLLDADFAAVGSTKPFTAVDFSVGVHWDSWRVEAFAQNAFDSRGQLSLNTACATTFCGPYARVYPTRPRLFGIKAGYDF